MSHIELLPYQKNRDLRKAFKKLKLNVEAVIDAKPFDIKLENKRLEVLLDFVEKYHTCQDRDTMQLLGMPFPPIYPQISPESDWYRFELWLQGKAIRKKLADQLPQDHYLISPDDLPDHLLESECTKLIDMLNELGFSIALVNEIPDKLLYHFLYETLQESFDLDSEGGWVLDGCSGYCPGCIQRPWCDTGGENAWLEDEEIGKMHLPPELEDFVSASPQSLQILKNDPGDPSLDQPDPPFQDIRYYPSVFDLSDFHDEILEMPINPN